MTVPNSERLDDALDGPRPDLDAVQQDYNTISPVVPVHLDGPALTHELPCRVADSRTLNVTDVTAEMIGSADLRRKFFKIIVTGNPIYLGFDKRAVEQGYAGVLPINTLIELPVGTQIWARCATASASSVVNYWFGSWAD